MPNPLKKIFAAKAEPAPAHDVFATTMFAHRNTVSGDDQYHCLVARARIDGMWEVGQETYFEARATRSMINIPPRPGGVRQTPQIVDGNTAYEMLLAYEKEHTGTGRGVTARMEGAGYPADMAQIAAEERIVQAEKSGGVAMKIAAKHKLPRRGK